MPLSDLKELYSGSTRSIVSDSTVEGSKIISWTHSPTVPSGGGRSMVVRASTALINWEQMTDGLIGSWVKEEVGVGLIARLMAVSVTGSGYFILKDGTKWGLYRGVPDRDLGNATKLSVFNVSSILGVQGWINLGFEVWNDAFNQVNIKVKQTKVQKPKYEDYSIILLEYQDTDTQRLVRSGAWGTLGISGSTSLETTTKHDYTVWFLKG